MVLVQGGDWAREDQFWDREIEIESFVLSRPKDIVSCVLLGKGIFGAKSRSEAYFLDKENEVCGIVRGIETVAFS